MTSIEKTLAALKQVCKDLEALALIKPKTADAAGDDTACESETAVKVKLTPIQSLEKKRTTAQDKLDKLNAKIDGGKSKTPDKDSENKTKLEDDLSNITVKISELNAKEAKPAPVKVAAKKEADKAEVKKHVPRITPAMTTKLQEAVESAGAEWDDKYKKEFVTHVNSLTNEQFAEVSLEGHMSRFASTHAPVSSGGGSAPIEPKTLTVPELVKQKKNLKQLSPGVFQNKTSGEIVTGPAENSDEEFEEMTHDDDNYIVGETTKRVYKPCEDGPDEFVGYLGVGEW